MRSDVDSSGLKNTNKQTDKPLVVFCNILNYPVAVFFGLILTVITDELVE